MFSAYWPDFNKVPDNVTTTYGLPYDYTSVMHYPRYAFSKNGKETIVAKVSYRTNILFELIVWTIFDFSLEFDQRKISFYYKIWCNGH